MHCAVVLGETNPSPGVETTIQEKPALVTALQESLTYCDRAFTALTDASGAEPVRFVGAPVAKLSMLGVSHMHSALHYGNLTTYMRLTGVVPPTSDPGFFPQPRK